MLEWVEMHEGHHTSLQRHNAAGTHTEPWYQHGRTTTTADNPYVEQLATMPPSSHCTKPCAYVCRGDGSSSCRRDSTCQPLVLLGISSWCDAVSMSACATYVAMSSHITGRPRTPDKVSVPPALVPGPSSSSAVSGITASTAWCSVKRATVMPLAQHMGHSAMLVVLPRWYH